MTKRILAAALIAVLTTGASSLAHAQTSSTTVMPATPSAVPAVAAAVSSSAPNLPSGIVVDKTKEVTKEVKKDTVKKIDKKVKTETTKIGAKTDQANKSLSNTENKIKDSTSSALPATPSISQ